MERLRASVEARRRGEEPPEDGYHGAYIAELAALPDDPVPQMLKRIEATMERRIHFDSGRSRASWSGGQLEFLPRLDTFERDGATRARASAYGDDDDRVLIRSETGMPTYRAADVVTSRTSSTAASTARSTCSAPTTTARELVRGRRANARLRPRAGRGAALTSSCT